MNLTDIINRLTIGVQRDDLVASYPSIINEALVEIQRRRSFQCMKKLDTFTVATGDRSVPLAIYENLILPGTPYNVSDLCEIDGLVSGTEYFYVNQETDTVALTAFGGSHGQSFGEVAPGETLAVPLLNNNTKLNIYCAGHSGLVVQGILYEVTSESARFKELTPSESPIHLQNSEDVLTPCDVWTREKVLRRQARLISNSILYSVYLSPFAARRVQLPVWIEWDAAVPVLNILVQAASDLPFSVSYYGYLPDLAAGTDTNYFTRNYPEMVVAKAKAIAFESINDPIAIDFEKLFEARFASAAGQDAYSAVAGIALRM